MKPFFVILSLLISSLCHSEMEKTHLDSFKNFTIPGSDHKVVKKDILYHTNGKLCWKDPNSHNKDAGIVYFQNGNKCWKDPKIYNGSSNGGILFLSNGEKLWKDPHVFNATSYGGIVYYPNGEKLWKDPQVYSVSSHGGIIYHANGEKLWKDPSIYSSGGIIYHSNGTKCWKDPLVYSDGGKCYDSKGKQIKFVGLSNSIDLGNNACVEIWPNGQFEITIDLGDQSYFVRSTDTKLTLLQNVGSSLYLYMPLSSNDEIWLFDQSDNWLKISER